MNHQSNSLKFIFILFFPFLFIQYPQAQSLGMQQLGSIGGWISASSGPSLHHSIGAVANTVIEDNDVRLDQGMFLGCDLSCDTIKISGIESLIYQNSLLSIYPNPTHNILRLEGGSLLIHRYEIFSLNGQLLENGKISNEMISTSNLAPGMYLLKVHGREGELTLLAKVIRL